MPNLEEFLLNTFEKSRRFRKRKVGTYHVGLLNQSCFKAMWNAYCLPEDQAHEKQARLRMVEGIIFHEYLQQTKGLWKSTETEFSKDFKTDSGKITIVGTLDAVSKEGVVYEFKRSGYISYKPKSQWIFQIQSYMALSERPEGCIVAMGSSNGEFCIKEWPVLFNNFWFNTLLNKAITLHTLLKHKQVPVCSCRTRQHDLEWIKHVNGG